MGYNTTIVIYNDALNIIENDPTFASELVKAIRINCHAKSPVNLTTRSLNGIHSAGQVIEQHHESGDVLIKVGGNIGTVINEETKTN